MDESTAQQRDEELATFLASPVPRRVPARIAAAAKRQDAGAVLFWIGLLFGVFGACFAPLFFPWGFWNDGRLASAEALTGEGRIVSAEPTQLKINGTKVWAYRFEYRGSGDDRLRNGESFTTGRKWQAGEAVRVRYLVGEEVACPEGARTTRAGGAAAFVLVFPATGLALGGFGWRARRRVLATLTHGRLTEAKVVGVTPTLVRVNGKPVFKVHLQELSRGAAAALVARCHPAAAVAFAEERLQSQQPVYVLYDPRWPGCAILPETL